MTAKVHASEPTTTSMKLLALALTTPILLLPCTKTFMAPLAVMALLGFFMLFGLLRQRQNFNTEDKALQVLPRCFLFLWLPMLISAIDAEAPTQVLAAAAYYPLYALMALAVVVLLRASAALRLVIVLLSWLVCISAFDGLAQTAVGLNMLNEPLNADGRAVSFFADNKSYGLYLGMLATLPLYTLYLVGANRLSHLLLTMFMLTAVLVVGDMSAWVMTAWAMLPYLFLVYIKGSRRPLVPMLVLPLWLGLIFMANWHSSVHVRQTVEQGFGLLNDGEYWRISAEIFGGHWFNGVGVGQFAQAFQPYMAPNALPPTGFDISHAHNIVLGVLTSTGVVGLLAFILIWAALWRMWRKSTPMQHKLALPVLMPVVALWWPLNASQDFYRPELAALTFFFLALGIAALTHQAQSK